MNRFSKPTMHLSGFRADAPLPDPKTLRTQSPEAKAVQDDPLIVKGGQQSVYIGASLLALVAIALVGFFSRKFEHVIVAAAILSMVLIGCFLFFGR